MALIENFDVDFEDYIIFHRGVAEANVKDDGHLHIIYQDGYDQDLGDPYGNNAKEWANKAKEYMDQAEDYSSQAGQKKQDVEDLLADISQTKEEAEALKDAMDQIVNELNGTDGDEPTDGLFDQLAQAKQEINNLLEEDMTEKINEIKNGYEDAKIEAETIVQNAEAWAQGTRGGVPVAPEDETATHNAKYYAENVTLRAEAWATGQMNGEFITDTNDPAYNNNAKYYKVLADEYRARAASYAVGGIQSYRNIDDTPDHPSITVVSQDQVQWTDSTGSTTYIGVSSKKFAELSKQEAIKSASSARQANQTLEDVNAVAEEYVKPLDKLNGAVRDEETGNYNLETISEETINNLFLQYFPEYTQEDLNNFYQAVQTLTYNIEFNNNLINTYEEELAGYEQGSEDWIRVRDKIYLLEHENAQNNAMLLTYQRILDQYNYEPTTQTDNNTNNQTNNENIEEQGG